jgi:3-methylcrotonyl-CoA carboxylase alpha subunit
MFHRLLIANRGEIACRVIRTAKRLGVTTIAVYSDADADALHVALADEAFPIGPAPARESYLSIEKMLAVAQRARAQAVHPGYGFLSENADFAEACAGAGLVFVGPSPHAMRLMGSKAHAKAVMEQAGVPVVPGHHGAQDLASLVEAAERVGFPVLVKASAGGGGKGMRVVAAAADLIEAIEGAKREALSSFGDDTVLIEKKLERPRHIEAQIFGDSFGEVVAFAERDCSIQRRHQKIIEETPAPLVSAELRRALRDAAVAAARSVGYVGAGTVEFLVEGEAFYFLEVNTRLQVEHPVTEMVAGVDLVEWQLRVAAGERLPVTQDALATLGHAIEARLYAESPMKGFLPSVGTLEHLREPSADSSLRLETGVREGDSITPFYDPMIAKVIAWGADREAARARLVAALREYEIVGVETNLQLLKCVLATADFVASMVDTRFLPNHPALIGAPVTLDQDEEFFVLAAGAAAWLAQARSAAQTPWDSADGWRLNGVAMQKLVFIFAEREVALTIRPQAGAFRLATPNGERLVETKTIGRRMSLRLDGVKRALSVIERADGFVVALDGRDHALRIVDPLAPPRANEAEEASLAAPLPARVTRVLASVGEDVKRGATLVTLEAMKMEIALAAPRDGRIREIRHAVGDMVRQGEELVVFVEGEAA